MNSNDLRTHLANLPLRFQTSIILISVTTFGVLLNYICHTTNIDAIGVRYLIVIPSSYVFFFVVVRVWIWLVLPQNTQPRSDGHSWNFLNNLDEQNSSPTISGPSSSSSRSSETKWSGGNGQFSGGGASENWDSATPAAIVPFSADGSTFSLPDIKVSDDGKDNPIAILLIAALFFAMIGGTIYVIYMGPTILADAAVQYAYGHGIVRRLSDPSEDENWMFGLFKSTIVVFLTVLILACTAGFYINSYCPNAKHLLDATHDICKIH